MVWLLLLVGIFFLLVMIKERNENEEYEELKKLAEERDKSITEWIEEHF